MAEQLGYDQHEPVANAADNARKGIGISQRTLSGVRAEFFWGRRGQRHPSTRPTTARILLTVGAASRWALSDGFESRDLPERYTNYGA